MPKSVTSEVEALISEELSKESIKMRCFWTFLLTCFAILVFFGNTCYAFDVTLAWDANSETNLAGYKLYYGVTAGGPYNGAGSSSGALPIIIPLSSLPDPATPKCTVYGLTEGTYYFVVTAFNTDEFESGYSNEASAGAVIPPRSGKSLPWLPLLLED
jgi:hypothetical protein